MNRTREEERRQAEALHLLPDERDREIETAARGRSGSVTLALSLLFPAACLLQGSGAWAAFLALALAGGWLSGQLYQYLLLSQSMHPFVMLGISGLFYCTFFVGVQCLVERFSV